LREASTYHAFVASAPDAGRPSLEPSTRQLGNSLSASTLKVARTVSSVSPDAPWTGTTTTACALSRRSTTSPGTSSSPHGTRTIQSCQVLLPRRSEPISLRKRGPPRETKAIERVSKRARLGVSGIELQSASQQSFDDVAESLITDRSPARERLHSEGVQVTAESLELSCEP